MDASIYRARARQLRERAALKRNPMSRFDYLDMARQYEELAQEAEWLAHDERKMEPPHD